jgi:putative hemolysin
LGTALSLQLIENQEAGIIVATVAVTVLLLIFGEIIPKTIATTYSLKLALLYWRPLRAFEIALRPLIWLIQIFATGVQKILGNPTESSRVSEEDIKLIISLGRLEGAVEHSEAEMLEKVLAFGDRQVHEVMTPRTEIIWVQKGTNLRQFLELYSEHTHTRFPVYESKMDNVIGLLSIKDIMKAIANKELGDEDEVSEVFRQAYFVPETKLVSHLVAELQQAGHQMAILIDEYGGTAGLVTLRRLVEEVVGRGGEEGSPLISEVTPIDDYTFAVDASIRLEEANDELNLNLPEGDYETLAGFLLHLIGRIPYKGEHILYNEFTFTVSEVSNVKIESVTVTAAAAHLED